MHRSVVALGSDRIATASADGMVHATLGSAPGGTLGELGPANRLRWMPGSE